MYKKVWFQIHTDYHTSADVTELGFFAVVVLELVGFVVDSDNRRRRFWFLLLHLHLLIIYEIDLDTQRAYLSHLLNTIQGQSFYDSREVLPARGKNLIRKGQWLRVKVVLLLCRPLCHLISLLYKIMMHILHCVEFSAIKMVGLKNNVPTKTNDRSRVSIISV